MSSEERDVSDETQQTPAGHEIPVPSREAVFRDLEKVARGKRDEPERDGPSEDDE